MQSSGERREKVDVCLHLVVPAKAGTHNPRTSFCEDSPPPNATERFRGMGPGVRRDDGEERLPVLTLLFPACRGSGYPPTRSAILTLFWRCGSQPFSIRRLLRGGRWQPSVNRFGRRFGRSEGSGNADSQRNRGNRREGGAKRRSPHDFGCVPAHPPSWAPSYLPLRADWARAPGRSGVFEDKRTLQRPSQSARTTQKEF